MDRLNSFCSSCILTVFFETQLGSYLSEALPAQVKPVFAYMASCPAAPAAFLDAYPEFPGLGQVVFLKALQLGWLVPDLFQDFSWV
jgi:hypothetical protein